MSHVQVKQAYGTTAQIAAYTALDRELVVNTDDHSLVIGDGTTAGGATRLTPGILGPQGRLTLTTATPVLSSAVTGATTIYYPPHIGDWAAVYNGTVWIPIRFAELSLQLDSNSGHTGYHQSGKIFDLFVFRDGSTTRLGSGPAWSSSTARGTGAGTTELQRLNGLWTNKVSITLRFGSSSGNTTSVSANQATYVGTFYATADGQTAMMVGRVIAAGGGNNILGLYNAYNRVRTLAHCADSTASWSYSTGSYRSANASNSNRITWVDGLGESGVQAEYIAYESGAAAGAAIVGVGVDSTSSPTGLIGAHGSTTMATARATVNPTLGLHYVQALEFGATSATWSGSPQSSLFASVDQ